jgi:predicted nucleic acid-binding protein
MPVVDASIVVDWVAPRISPDTSAGRLLARLAEEGTPILAPRLLLEETANALVTGIRRRRWGGAEADASFLLLRRLPVELVDQPPDLDRAYELSRRYDEHPVYDLVYVAVAERLGEQLVTADEALRRRLGLPFVIGPD